ncbi:response regulator transcription factor [Enhydrobacter aerosaccus]|uniref:response regulator transcription factor n=1 Tax=Enhydrobacter aerosaccus TaxID=225324 RepID=UPI001481E1DD|nr:response regulator transcription factor [Enhydrobacter aerosaccus]
MIFVDDDDDFREAASAELEDLGFAVTTYASGTALLAAIEQSISDIAADVIVLDWNMPDMTGIELVPRLRRQGIKLPIVFLTGRSTPYLESAALDHGALDFVDKARGMPILAKRVRLIFESSKRPPELAVDETLEYGKLQLKPRISRVFWNGLDVNLTLTEFNVVRLLASNAGNHVSYRAVYDCMHHVGFIAGSGEHGYRTNVRSTIKRIRNKFRVIDPTFSEIENYPSFGYRWGGPPEAKPEAK